MRITELTLASGFIEELRDFYIQRLGFTEVPAAAGENKQSFTLQAGHSRLSFVTGAEDARYHFAFNIPYNCVGRAMKWLEKKRVHLVEEKRGQGAMVQFPNWKAQSIYFFDPAGNIVELIGRQPLPPTEKDGFDASYITGVSEIGAAFDDVNAVRQWLNSVHGIPDFIRQPHSADFSALGDDEGLLLLVPVDRDWFMGGFPATKQPTALKLELPGKGPVSLVWNS